MARTDVAIRNAKPGAKPVKMTDGGGMYLLVTPAGGKLWRLKYRIDGREKQRGKIRSQLQSESRFTGIANEYCVKRKRDDHKASASATASRIAL